MEVNWISTDKNQTKIDFFLFKKVRLAVKDIDRFQMRDGILMGWDDENYYLKHEHGESKGKIIAFQKASVHRIEEVSNKDSI